MFKIAIEQVSCAPAQSAKRPRAKPDQGDSRPFSAKENRPINWWSSVACGRRSFVKIGNHISGARCGSRSCFQCSRSKMDRFGKIATHLKREKGEVFRSCIITPTDAREVRTEEDIRAFFRRFRTMLRSWLRSAGLGYAFWVAEGVVKYDEAGSIRCPLRDHSPDPDWLFDSGLQLCDEIQSMQDNCRNGDCKFCGGSGYLPAVHLHIHLLTSSKPFYYGGSEEENETDLAAMHPNGKGGYCGLAGFCDRFDLFSRVQPVQNVDQLQHYLSKCMVQYVTKGAAIEDQEQESDTSSCAEKSKGKKIDYQASAIEQAIVSWTIGNNKSRGAVGRAYGLKSRIKDVNQTVQMTLRGDSKHNPLSAAVSGEKYERPAKKEKTPPVLVHQLQIAKGSDLTKCINVLKKTQLDMPSRKSRKTQLDMPSRKSRKTQLDKVQILSELQDINGHMWSLLQDAPLAIDQNDLLARYWDRTPVVRSDQSWTVKYGKGRIFGKGSAMLFKPVDLDQKTIIEALEVIVDLPWRFWSLYIDDLTRRETHKKGA